MPGLPRTKPEKRGDRPRRRWLERATIYGLGGSVAIHVLLILIAALITVRFTFGDAGGSGGEGVEFAVLSDVDLASENSALLADSPVVDTTMSETISDMDLLSDTGQDRSAEDLSESIAPALDPGGGSLTSLDGETGSAGAGSGDGASFFGLEAEGHRFAYIVDVSGSMKSTTGGEQTRWDLTRAELVRSLGSLQGDAEFHVQLYSSGSRSLFGVNEWTRATPINKRLSTESLFLTEPAGGTEPEPAFRTVFALEPEPDAIYYMTDGEVSDPASFAAAVRKLNGRDRIPVHCILVGDAGSPDAQQRVESLMLNIAKQSGGRFTHIREGRP